MNDINFCPRLEYGTGTEISVYRGEFEVIHPDCAFVGTAKYLKHEVELEILNRPAEGSYSWARFSLKNPLSESKIHHILTPWFDSNILRRARVWCNGATIFEVLVNDILLNSLQPIARLPFGGIVDWIAYSDLEHAIVLSPSSEEISGKDRLLDAEGKLKQEAKEAELMSYRRLTEAETFNTYTEPERDTRSWLALNEERILETALKEGYFESPKKITTEELAKLLGMSSTTLNIKIRSINRQVLGRLLGELQ